MIWFLFFIAVALTTCSVLGIIRQRNPIIMLMCVVLIINASILILATVDRIRDVADGRFMAVVLMIFTGILAAWGFGAIRQIYKDKQMADIDEFRGTPE